MYWTPDSNQSTAQLLLHHILFYIHRLHTMNNATLPYLHAAYARSPSKATITPLQRKQSSCPYLLRLHYLSTSHLISQSPLTNYTPESTPRPAHLSSSPQQPSPNQPHPPPCSTRERAGTTPRRPPPSPAHTRLPTVPCWPGKPAAAASGSARRPHISGVETVWRLRRVGLLARAG